MSTPLDVLITDAGIAAAANAQATGIAVAIARIKLGDMGYTPQADRIALSNERADLPVAGGSNLGNGHLHITALEDGAVDYWVRELGFFDDADTLIAVWSDPVTPLAYKSAGNDLVLALDLTFAAVPVGTITVEGGAISMHLSLAGELAQLATAQLNANLREIRFNDRLHTLEAA